MVPRSRMLLRPRWLCWHAVAILAVIGMAWLGDWQLRRALSGNELSWAYTFEWPLFAIFGLYFWARTIRDELREADPQQKAPEADEPSPDSDQAHLDRLKAEVRGHGRWHGLR